MSVISDEIHGDLLRAGRTHLSLAGLFPEEKRLIVCTSPSKTFNLAGNHLANIIIPDREIREEWEKRYHYMPNPISVAATVQPIPERKMGRRFKPVPGRNVSDDGAVYKVSYDRRFLYSA